MQQAVSLYAVVGDQIGVAAATSNLGSVFEDLGEYRKAAETFTGVLPIYRTAADWPGELTTFLHLVVDDLRVGDVEKAKSHALQMMSDMGAVTAALGTAGPNFTVNNRNSILHAMGSLMNVWCNAFSDPAQKQESLGLCLQGLAVFQRAGERSAEATSLDTIGSVYDRFGETQKAIEFYSQALPIRRAVGDRSGEATTLGKLGAIFEKSEPEVAILFAKQAVNLLQSIRRDNRGLDESLRKSFEKSIEFHYRHLAGLLVDRQRFGEAEEVLNLLKDKEAADFIRRDAVADQLKAATLSDAERQALDRYEQIVTQIVSDGQAKSALVARAEKTTLTADESAQADRLDKDLSASNTVLLKYFDELGKTFAAKSAAAKSVGELRDSEALQDTLQTRGSDVVAIYTLVLPDKYTAMLVTSSARRAYVTAIPEAELNPKIFQFRQQLQNPGSDPVPLAQELYKVLFPEGLRRDLDAIGVKTIMWSIDSTIRYVPIAALHDGSQYLVSRFRNSLITPASQARLKEKPPEVWKGVGFGVSKANGEFTRAAVGTRRVAANLPPGGQPTEKRRLTCSWSDTPGCGLYSRRVCGGDAAARKIGSAYRDALRFASRSGRQFTLAAR